MTTRTAEPMAQRKLSTYTPNNNHTLNSNILLNRLTYGVPSEKRILTPGVFRKRFDLVRHCLVSLGYPNCQRSVIFELIRLYAYYGKVYPKAEHMAKDAYCSKRTFWRAIARLEQDGFIDRINRYLSHLQISNSYRLDKLILVLVRYIAEHAGHLFAKDAPDIIFAPAQVFWKTIGSLKVRLRDPIPLTPTA